MVKYLRNCTPEERIELVAARRVRRKERGALRTTALTTSRRVAAGRPDEPFYTKYTAGMRFGSLVLIRCVGSVMGAAKRSGWLCACDCGCEAIKCLADMRAGKVKSCGNMAVHRSKLSQEELLERVLARRAVINADRRAAHPRKIKFTPEETRANAKQWRLDNPDRNRELIRRWNKAHPEARRAMHHNRRAKTKGGVSPSELKEMRRVHGKRCAMCRTAGKMTIDHIIPLAAGGPHTRSNIQFLCSPCNSAKRDLSPETFARMKGLLL